MERKRLLEKLINYDGNVADILALLGNFGWDSEEELVQLQANNLYAVLQRFLDGKFTAKDIEYWASSIEMREDIGMSSKISTVMHHLANPSMYEPITNTMVKKILAEICGEA